MEVRGQCQLLLSFYHMGLGGKCYYQPLLFFSNNLFIFLLYMFCLSVCLCEGVRVPGTGVTDSCELPRGCWEMNLGPPE